MYLASDHEILNKVRSISIYENFSQPFFDGLEGIVDFKNKFITKDRLLVRVFAGNKSSHLMNASERMILFKNIDKYYSRYLKKNMILKEIAVRMKLVEGDSVECMSGLLDPVDVIYLDPMFPHREKSALGKKEMRALRPQVGDDDDASALLEAALLLASHRVVVKRPRYAGALDDTALAYAIEGASSRFDIYPKRTFKKTT